MLLEVGRGKAGEIAKGTEDTQGMYEVANFLDVPAGSKLIRIKSPCLHVKDIDDICRFFFFVVVMFSMLSSYLCKDDTNSSTLCVSNNRPCRIGVNVVH